jgi:hypothetical protein
VIVATGVAAQTNYPENSLSLIDPKGVLTLRGFVPGLGTIMEAMLVVERWFSAGGWPLRSDCTGKQ